MESYEEYKGGRVVVKSYNEGILKYQILYSSGGNSIVICNFLGDDEEAERKKERKLAEILSDSFELGEPISKIFESHPR